LLGVLISLIISDSPFFMKGDKVLYFSSFKIGFSILKADAVILGETTLART